LTELVFFAPMQFAREEILAGPANPMGVAIDISADQDDTALPVLHIHVAVDLFGSDLAALCCKFDEIAAGTAAVPAGHINVAVMEERGWNEHIAVGSIVMPQNGAVGRDAVGAGIGLDDVVADAADFREDGRGVRALSSEVFAPPKNLASLLIQ